MTKLTISNFSSLSNEASFLAALNAAFDAVETAMENTYSRDGTTPNTLSADLDVNSQDILNVNTISANSVNVNGASVTGFIWEGAWVTATSYTVNDGVSNSGNSYVCILDHTSDPTITQPGTGSSWETYWDLMAQEGSSGPGPDFPDNTFEIYNNSDASKKIAFQASGISTSTTRTITMPDSDVDLTNVANALTAASAPGTDNILIKMDGTGRAVQATGISVDDSDNVTGVADLTMSGTFTVTGGGSLTDTLVLAQGVNTQTGTTYTLVLGDASETVEMNNASANTVTIPPNSSVAFPVGTEVNFVQYGAGATTIAAGAGVTLRSKNSNLILAGQYSACTARKRDTDEWVVVGDLV